MLIRDLLQDPTDRLYVGRESELKLMRDTLSTADGDWKLLHFYGQGGIGKTTVLRLFINEKDAPLTFLLDGHSGFHTPADFLDRLRDMMSSRGFVIHRAPEQDPVSELAHDLNEIAKEKRIVLLLDTFELWNALEDWLQEVWLPLLAPNVRVCTVGRYPLEGKWLQGNWNHLVRNVRMNPLNHGEIVEYAQAQGIQDKQLQDKIQYFSQGVPLALSLACEVIRKQGKSAFVEGTQQKVTIGYLSQELVKDIRNPFLQKCLDAVSVLWTFNQDLLEFILGETIDNAVFREFCRLPFITVRDEGWSLHDSVRHFVSADFAHRQPATCQEYRRKALFYLRKLTVNPVRKYQLAMDKLFLHDNELVRGYCLTGDEEGIEVRYAQEADLDRMEQLCCMYYEALGLSVDLPLPQYIRSIWEADSTSFFTLWKDDELIDFFSFIPLHEKTRNILKQIPVTQQYVSQAQLHHKEYVMFLMGRIPSLDGDISGAAWRIRVQQIASKAKRFLFITPIEKWASLVASLGLELLPEHAYLSPGGSQYRVYKLDLSENDFESHIDSLLGNIEIAPSISVEEVSQSVKKIMVQFHTFDTDPQLLQSLQRDLQLDKDLHTDAAFAESIRAMILASLDGMSQGSKKDQLLQQILSFAYVMKIGSHEVVADRLQLPMATYYRYLKRAITRLAQEVMKVRGA